VPLFTSGGLGLGLVSSGLGLKNLVLFSGLATGGGVYRYIYPQNQSTLKKYVIVLLL